MVSLGGVKGKLVVPRLIVSVGTFCMFMYYRTTSVFCEHFLTKRDKQYLLVYRQSTLCTVSVE